MMPLIKTALRHSSTRQRKVRKQEAMQVIVEQTADQSDPKSCLERSQHIASIPASSAKLNNSRERDREFSMASTAAPRRLNDTVQAPPDITKFPRGIRKPSNDKSSGVLSMAQKVMMEEERERAITHYRELKARRLCGDAVVKARVAIP